MSILALSDCSINVFIGNEIDKFLFSTNVGVYLLNIVFLSNIVSSSYGISLVEEIDICCIELVASNDNFLITFNLLSIISLIFSSQ